MGSYEVIGFCRQSLVSSDSDVRSETTGTLQDAPDINAGHSVKLKITTGRPGTTSHLNLLSQLHPGLSLLHGWIRYRSVTGHARFSVQFSNLQLIPTYRNGASIY